MIHIPSLRPMALTATLVLCVAIPQFSFAQAAVPAGCNPQIMQRAEKERIKMLEQKAQASSQLYAGHYKLPSFLSQSGGILSGCLKYGNKWQLSSLLGAQVNPLITETFNAAQMQLVQQKCDEVRQKIPQELMQDPRKTAMSALKGLPGYQNVPDPFQGLAESYAAGNAQLPSYNSNMGSYSSFTGSFSGGNTGGISPPTTTRQPAGAAGVINNATRRAGGAPGITPPITP